jgi:hypothetical protein
VTPLLIIDHITPCNILPPLGTCCHSDSSINTPSQLQYTPVHLSLRRRINALLPLTRCLPSSTGRRSPRFATTTTTKCCSVQPHHGHFQTAAVVCMCGFKATVTEDNMETAAAMLEAGPSDGGGAGAGRARPACWALRSASGRAGRRPSSRTSPHTPPPATRAAPTKRRPPARRIGYLEHGERRP